MIRSRILSAVAAAAIAGGGLVAFAPSAGAATLLSCTGLSAIASLNPTIKSNDAAYVKVVLKDSDGTKLDLFSLPIPVDNNKCFVDAGIRTNQGGQDIRYLLDDQTFGNTILNRTGTGALDGKNVGVTAGSATCNNADVVNVSSSYPQGYPLQGKTVWKFEEVNPSTLVQIQIQQYVRTGRDLADPNAQHITVKGMVIKGPGIGGDTSAVLNFFPTNSVKNLNAAECIDANVNDDAVEASLAELTIIQADGSDGDALVDPWVVTIP